MSNKAIKEVDFKNLIVNLSTSRSSFVAQMQEKDSDEMRYVALDKTILFDEKEDGTYLAKASTVKSMMAASLVIYNKSTLLFEKNIEVIQELEKLLKEHDEIAVLRSSQGIYVGAPPENIELKTDGTVQDSKGQKDISESEHHKKENLKAYETPSNTYDLSLIHI